MKKLKKRKKNRLQNYDYSNPGYYYITICIKNFIEYFGEISNEKMKLNDLGKSADSKCHEIPDHYDNIEIEIYKVMPNHIHLIIILNETGKDSEKKRVGYISTLIKSLKGIITKEIRKTFNIPFEWQRSFYDHIIRNEKSLYRISSYIKHNELKWIYESKIPRN
ncbi:MAG: transposase [Candidatus Cloacimonadota bacterium]|nr:transposase [Candidatus Cloacimonadota bacterium]